MADPTSPFNNPEVLCLSVPAVRRYWGYLLQDCIEKHAQEHPLYALFSSIFSTLSKAISAPGCQVSPMSIDGSIVYSYPQCRIINKKAAGGSEDDTMSVYPDFGLLHLITERPPSEKVKVEKVRLLIEIKRLYSAGKECLWTDEVKRPCALDIIIFSSIRQLLLQAYSAFSVYDQPEVFIMLISGVHFTLFKFERPENFKPLPQVPRTSNKKRKLEVEGATTGEPKSQPAKEISDHQLTSLIPLEYVEVVCHGAPVFEDIEAGGLELHLSDVFRQALHERLDGVTFQPCSLFNLHTAQYTPEDDDITAAWDAISDWYSETRLPGTPSAPRQRISPYVYSPPNGKEMSLSPGYKGKASGVGHRGSLPRKSKDYTNSLRESGVSGDGEGSGKSRLGTAGDVKSVCEGGLEVSDEEEEGKVFSFGS